MTFHETSNRNPSPIKPKGRNRLGITARPPAALGVRGAYRTLRHRRLLPRHRVFAGFQDRV